ncbi:MAG: asparagine synthase, partial [Acidimicrobiales bacterium]
MLNALSVSLENANEDGLRRAALVMERQGFVLAWRFAWNDVVAEAWCHPSQRDVADSAVEIPTGTACCVGPLWYRGRFGNEALRLLIDEGNQGDAIDETSLRGNYALFLQTRSGCTLFNDALGFVRVYACRDGRFHSTSWLAACAYAG